ncbi:hydroxypyruvate isomerase family protein [Mycolicibacterium brisbanense]|nr:TIM barrel protein [Mycolicibacterium brisbanense]MCV7160484.1 TIM barrel protein [Mycolicibacterium brisbanense]
MLKSEDTLDSTIWQQSQANISLLFTELPFERRPAAAAEAGFTAIECWWPFASATPGAGVVDAFVASVADAGVRLRGLNFFAGYMAAGDRGIASHPGRRQEFDDSVAIALDIGARLGVTGFNALYGNRLDDVSDADQDDAALTALTSATELADSIGATVLIEPVSGVATYPLRLAADALDVIRAVRRRITKGRIALLADLYHLTVNGDDLFGLATAHADDIGHVQVADAPGRHEPGSGNAPLTDVIELLAQRGYTGTLGLEYIPIGDTVAGLEWLRQLVPSFGHGNEAARTEVAR